MQTLDNINNTDDSVKRKDFTMPKRLGGYSHSP